MGIFKSVKDKDMMDTIQWVCHAIAHEATTRFNELQSIKLDEMRKETGAMLAELKAKSLEKDIQLADLELRVEMVKFRKKRGDLVKVHSGESRRKRGRPTKPSLRLVVAG